MNLLCFIFKVCVIAEIPKTDQRNSPQNTNTQLLLKQGDLWKYKVCPERGICWKDLRWKSACSLSSPCFVVVPMPCSLRKTQFYGHILDWKIKQRAKVTPAHFYYQNKIKSNISMTCLLVVSSRAESAFTLHCCKISFHFTLCCTNMFACDCCENFPQVNGITWRWKFSNLSAFNSTVALVRRSGGREPGKFSSSWILWAIRAWSL